MVYWNKTNFSTKNTCNCKKKNRTTHKLKLLRQPRVPHVASANKSWAVPKNNICLALLNTKIPIFTTYVNRSIQISAFYLVSLIYLLLCYCCCQGYWKGDIQPNERHIWGGHPWWVSSKLMLMMLLAVTGVKIKQWFHFLKGIYPTIACVCFLLFQYLGVWDHDMTIGSFVHESCCLQI